MKESHFFVCNKLFSVAVTKKEYRKKFFRGSIPQHEVQNQAVIEKLFNWFSPQGVNRAPYIDEIQPHDLIYLLDLPGGQTLKAVIPAFLYTFVMKLASYYLS